MQFPIIFLSAALVALCSGAPVPQSNGGGDLLGGLVGGTFSLCI